MKIVKLQGGLGNQMFQYVFYLKLKQNYQKVYLDTSWFNKARKAKWSRPLQLCEAFGIELPILKNNRLNHYPIWIRMINKAIRLMSKESFYVTAKNNNRNYHIENQLFKETYYLSIEKGFYDGYWQSIKYFEGIEDLIYKTFKFNISDPLVPNRFEDFFKNFPNNTSLHWRRGDYIDNSGHDILKENYFKTALIYLIEKKKIDTVFVFSEDFNYVEKKLKSFNLGLKFINVSKQFINSPPHVEMYLMTKCSNKIGRAHV